MTTADELTRVNRIVKVLKAERDALQNTDNTAIWVRYFLTLTVRLIGAFYLEDK